MAVDPGDHIPLIYRVIGQMSIPINEYDEAFGIGQLAITEAARKYDPTRQVPVANWLARNVRWSLQSWRRSQRGREEAEVYIRPPSMEPLSESSVRLITDHSIAEEYLASLHADKTGVEAHIGYKEVVRVIHELPTLQRNVILGAIAGYSGVEMAAAFHETPVAISRARKRAQAKIREALELK